MGTRGDVAPWALSLKPDVTSDVTRDVTVLRDVPSIELSWRAEALKPEGRGMARFPSVWFFIPFAHSAISLAYELTSLLAH